MANTRLGVAMMRVGFGYFTGDLIFMIALGVKPLIVVHHAISLVGLWSVLWAGHGQVLTLPLYAFAEYTNPLRALCVTTNLIASLNWPSSERASEVNREFFTPLFMDVFAVTRAVIFPICTVQLFYCYTRYWGSKQVAVMPMVTRIIGFVSFPALTVGSCIFVHNHWAELGWPHAAALAA